MTSLVVHFCSAPLACFVDALDSPGGERKVRAVAGQDSGADAGSHRRDLHRARLVVGQLRDEALASGEPFQVADLALDATALDELWDGLDRVDTHFWKDESFHRYMESRAEALGA